MKYPSLEGKRYIALARCSTDGQVDTSNPDQFNLMAAFADEHKMAYVDKVALDGVSGSLPGARTDIDELIHRKRTRNDFDVLLVQDTTRFTRGGIAHGSNLEYQLNAVGVEVVFVTDNIIEGDFGGLQKAVLYLSGKQHAKSISLATSRGSMSSLLADRSAHCRLPPYGIDRLYVASDGTPCHIIRNLPDGSQVKLDPTTKTVLARFGRSARSGTRQHYIKQKDERIVLVPGAPEAVAAINLIFRKYHLEGWGYRRIATELNAQGVPAARGKNWSMTAVNQILHNPTYLGLGIANRNSAGIYSVRSPNQPKPSHVNERTLATSKVPPRKLRPRSEWFERHEKALETLLDADVRAVALSKLDALVDKLAHVPQPRSDKDRHSDSDFILKGILTSKQGGHPMTGRRTGRRGKRIRYYSVSRGATVPVRGSILTRLIQAEPIEQAVIAALEELLQATATLRQDIERMVREQMQTMRAEDADISALRKQPESIAAKLSFLIDELDDVGRDVAKAKMSQLQSQLRALDQQINQTAQRTSLGDQDVDATVASVLRQLDELADNIQSLPPTALRRVLKLFVAKLEADLETKTIAMELRLPTWAITAADAIKTACASATDLHAREQPRHTAKDAILALFDCAYAKQGRNICYGCTRRRAA
jgi:hypothetical protein